MSQMPSPVNSPDLLSPTGSYALRNLSDYASLKAQNDLAKSQLNLEKVKINQLAEQFKAEMGQRQSEQAAGQQENEKQRAFAMQQTQQTQQFEGGQRELDRRIQEQQLKQQDDQFMKLREYEMNKWKTDRDTAMQTAKSATDAARINAKYDRRKEVIKSQLAAAQTAHALALDKSAKNRAAIVDATAKMATGRIAAKDAMVKPITSAVQQALQLAVAEEVLRGVDDRPAMERGIQPAGDVSPRTSQETQAAYRKEIVTSVAGRLAAQSSDFEAARPQVEGYLSSLLLMGDNPDDPAVAKFAQTALNELLATGKVDAFEARELGSAVAKSMRVPVETMNDIKMGRRMSDLNQTLGDRIGKTLEFGRGAEDFQRQFVDKATGDFNKRADAAEQSLARLFSDRDVTGPEQLLATVVVGATNGNPNDNEELFEKLKPYTRTAEGRAMLRNLREWTAEIDSATARGMDASKAIKGFTDELEKLGDLTGKELAAIDVAGEAALTRINQDADKRARPRGEK